MTSLRFSHVSSAIVAALVGFFGSLAIVLAAIQALGATPAQTVSWVASLCLAMAATSSYLSWRHKIPIITAWSTPGAALIGATSGIALEAAVGAFLLSAVLVLASAAFKPLGAMIARIPVGLASAMLAGVLLDFVVAVFTQGQAEPFLVLPLVALFLVARLVSPSGAVLVVLVAGALLARVLGLTGGLPELAGLSSVELIVPAFDPAVLIGLGLPLFLVTMASQNLPGFAVLRAADYPVPSRSILAVTGLSSLLTAPFGAHSSNMAAITASICTGPDVHADKAKRWPTGVVYGLCYLLLAIFAAYLVGLFVALPIALIATVAGLALASPLTGALAASLREEEGRFAAVLTFVVTASGLTFLDIGSAFWGLTTGLVAMGLERAWKAVKGQ